MHPDSTNIYAPLHQMTSRGLPIPGKKWSARWFDICDYFNEISSSMLKMTQLKIKVVYVQFRGGKHSLKKTNKRRVCFVQNVCESQNQNSNQNQAHEALQLTTGMKQKSI